MKFLIAVKIKTPNGEFAEIVEFEEEKNRNKFIKDLEIFGEIVTYITSEGK